MDTLTYQETTDIVEKFMIDTKIRKYCTEICKGKCCGSCYTKNDQACHLSEGRRLCCSIFLCFSLHNKFSIETRKILHTADIHIRNQYHNNKHKRLENIYFTAPTKTFLKTVRFSTQVIKALNNINIKEIVVIMNKLIKKKKDKHSNGDKKK